jgi:tetratricopeptide (TPR) repeat protein
MRTAHLTLPLLFVLVLVLGTGCGDNFASVQAEGTIEAFEQYLADNPDGRFAMEATAQLETLYLEKARKEKSLAAYDAYLERFPEGDIREKVLAEREKFLFEDSKQKGTVEAWDQFLTEYPKAKKERLKEAKRLKRVAEYRDQLSWTEPAISRVNLAEDPTGPKDGWGFTMEVTNNGEKTIADLRFTIDYLGPNDAVLDSREWPVVAENWGVPMEEEKKVPMKPGDTRTWFWSAGDLPKKWTETVQVTPTRLAFVE